MGNRVYFRSPFIPYILIAPQLVISLVFFFWPAGVALSSAFFVQNAFTGSKHFVALQNFVDLWQDKVYLKSFVTTAIFSAGVTVISMGLGLWLAVKANSLVRGSRLYKTLLTWPYAVAPAMAGVLWLFLFSPSIGFIANFLTSIGISWNFHVNSFQAMALVVIAASWRQIAYNFLFFLAGLQTIQRPLIEAAEIDGAGPFKCFWTIVFPLLSPTTFFLLVINIIYSLFETFGLIDTVTEGGPGNSTNILVYQVFQTGFEGQDLGSSAAQSVILMILVIIMTFFQFRFIGTKTNVG